MPLLTDLQISLGEMSIEPGYHTSLEMQFSYNHSHCPVNPFSIAIQEMHAMVTDIRPGDQQLLGMLPCQHAACLLCCSLAGHVWLTS